MRDRLRFKLPASSSAVIAIRPASNHPQVISTSRHITKGLIDLSNEQWHDGELSGISKVVAGDPYELRIVEHASILRVKLDTSITREIPWKIKLPH